MCKRRLKTLYRHEIRLVSPILLCEAILMFIGLFLCILLMLDMREEVTLIGVAYSGHQVVAVKLLSEVLRGLCMVLYPAMAVVTILQFRESKVGNTGEFMASLPFQKKEMFTAKYLVGVATITIPCLFVFLMSVIMRAVTIPELSRQALFSRYGELLVANESVWNLVANVFMFWLGAILIYSLFILIQSLIRPCIIAAVIGLGASMAPYYIAHQLDLIFGWQTSKLFNGLHIFQGDLLGHEVSLSEPGWVDSAVFVVFDGDLYKAWILPVLILLFVVLARHFFHRKEDAGSERFMSSSLLQNIFVGCASICIGLILASIGGGFSRPLLTILILILALIIALLLNQAIERYSS